MKKILSTAIFGLTLFYSITAQEVRHDNIWLFGKPPNNPEEMFGGSQLDFSSFPLEAGYFEIPFDFGEIAMISDSSGQLLFYTNGCKIANREHQIMVNGDSLNPGDSYNSFCELFGYPTSQAEIVLPLPGSNHLYYLFHIQEDDSHFNEFLLFSVIDMEKNGGLGEVVKKNQLLFTAHEFGQQVTCVRHANGRDWWLVLPYSTINIYNPSNKYFKFLFTPEGISGPFVQEIGEGWDYQFYSGQAAFSPNGEKYARMNPFNGVRLFDFDRCSGEFSNPLSIHFPEDTIVSGGVAFSPNNRFMYISASSKVYQFDTWASDIENSRKTVAVYDGFMSPFWTRFYQQMLAPNGKIYITAPNGVNMLHVINRPNLPGDSCKFEQHGLILPSFHDWNIPNFPHFRLGPVDGSSCDTLGLDNHPLAGFVYEVFPALTVGFTDNSSYEPTEWYWDFGDGESSVQVNPVHEYATLGEYYVCLTVSNNYDSDTFCRWVEVDSVTTASVAILHPQMTVQLWPNPASSEMHISLPAPLTTPAEWRLYNAVGQMVHRTVIPAWQREQSLSLAGVPPGLYLWQVRVEGRRVGNGKVVVEK